MGYHYPSTAKRKIREYYGQLYAHKFDNLKEMDQNTKLPKLDQDEIDSPNSAITIKDEFVI